MTAEGVEDRKALDILTDYRCDQGQGYFFSKPVPAKELPDWIKQYEKKSLVAGTP